MNVIQNRISELRAIFLHILKLKAREVWGFVIPFGGSYIMGAITL